MYYQSSPDRVFLIIEKAKDLICWIMSARFSICNDRIPRTVEYFLEYLIRQRQNPFKNRLVYEHLMVPNVSVKLHCYAQRCLGKVKVTSDEFE